jgi:FkbM family methyltransferase
MNHKIWPPNGTLSQWILDQFPPGYIGWGVDVGASDGISINTTYALEASHRWTILSVEANPGFGPLLKQHRARVQMCAVSSEEGSGTFHINEDNWESFSSLRPTTRTDVPGAGNVPVAVEAKWRTIEVPIWTVDGLLALWEFPRLDLLCVDTEGTELDVLRGCDLARWKPRVIVTECWDKVGPIDPYLESFGYVKSARSVHNDCWKLKETA